MANISVRYYSNCLRRTTSFNLVIPNDKRDDIPAEDNPYLSRDMKTLFLLHGYTGDGSNWVPEELCNKYNFAIVIPNGENSFWLDGPATGHEFCKMLGVELIDYVRKTFGLAKKREDTCIMGLSMGGFGALHTAFAYPEVFGKLVALSSALIHHQVAEKEAGQGDDVANYDYYVGCFGDPSKLLESENNPETLVKKIKATNAPMPEIYMACGRDDFLIENNRAFHRFLEEEKVDHTYIEDEGVHDMVFWSKYVQEFVPKLFG
ncbi:MAG: esterase [Lachnospiraceae bacterium]|nr:esterase [Lachnospiraceae bacterium]